ncbi:hypothetical protein HK098_008033 [Nowakowskiella sp. JEL0407]|nr:hypothetical protein HK098_008033 [Nowakowskiella sp. JEL0407]
MSSSRLSSHTTKLQHSIETTGNFAKKLKTVAGSMNISDPSEFSGAVAHWFRSDLRLSDNPGLYEASKLSRTIKRPLVSFYIFSPTEWVSHDYSAVRADFHLRNLIDLKSSLSKLNIPLMVFTSTSAKNVDEIIEKVVADFSIQHVYWNIEYEVDEAKRDARIKKKLEKLGVTVKEHHDQCVVKPDMLSTKQGKPYSVYTPFKKSWFEYVKLYAKTLQEFPPPEANVTQFPPSIADQIAKNSILPPHFPSQPLSETDTAKFRTMYPPGEINAKELLDNFLAQRSANYKVARDFPGQTGTSKLSHYLAAGVLTTKQCINAAKVANSNKLDSGNESLVKWIEELIWREFYRAVLVNFDWVCKNRAFKKETEGIEWNDDEETFRSWCQGKTGYPIVDAGMRELNETGWMNNRVRMIAAMFLTKDLLIDWRKGEKYFMNHLVDGDFASNNGGWQWAASTGTDSQPYFRIFNPLLQSEKFDPEGKYIKQYIPELRNVKASAIHEPYNKLPPKEFKSLGYPKPIVDHKVASKKAIEEFKRAAEAAKAGEVSKSKY